MSAHLDIVSSCALPIGGEASLARNRNGEFVLFLNLRYAEGVSIAYAADIAKAIMRHISRAERIKLVGPRRLRPDDDVLIKPTDAEMRSRLITAFKTTMDRCHQAFGKGGTEWTEFMFS
jgi:hypothetical protein